MCQKLDLQLLLFYYIFVKKKFPVPFHFVWLSVLLSFLLF
jgi:hypothetical protein